MYFEPSRKTYYRFPSSQSITDMNSRLYFPEKPSYTEEDTRLASKNVMHVPEKETHNDFY